MSTLTLDRSRTATFAGLPLMMGFTIRRSRIFYACWVLGLTMLMPATVHKYHDLVPPGTSQVGLDLISKNPTMQAIVGIPYDITTPGGFTTWRVGTFVAALVAMMAAMGVIRATRADEELGRLELIGSAAVGRPVILTAALVVACGMSAVIGVLSAGSMIAMGCPAAGSIAVGLGFFATGAMFAGIAAVFAQVFESTRTVRYWSLGVALGGLYLLRAMVDATPDSSPIRSLQWLMPMDWFELIRPFAHERFWVAVLPLAVATITIGLAYSLQAHRDHGAGLKPAGLGAATAPDWLSGAWGLAWRLSRVSVVGWVISTALLVAAMGSLALSVEKMLNDQPKLKEMFQKMGSGAAQLTDAFYSAMLGITVMVITLCAVLLLSRVRSEEIASHAEQVLATATSRWRLLASHAAVALVTSLGLLLLAGALLPSAQAARDHRPDLIITYMKAAAVLAPGLVLVIGLGVFLIGWFPQLFGLTWIVLGWSFAMSWLAPLFGAPEWLTKIQPWSQLPHLPADSMHWGIFAIELGIGLALISLGFIGFRRRDLETN